MNPQRDEDFVDFAKMKVGLQTLKDANLQMDLSTTANANFKNKTNVLKQIEKRDLTSLADISDFYYESNGLYQKLCRYLAQLYRYDYMITPYIIDGNKQKEELLKKFDSVLNYFDNSQIKYLLDSLALEVVVKGSYYGYILEFKDYFSIQQLPSKYCRSRFSKGSIPTVEFNLKYFDAEFKDTQYRIKVLSMFPKEIQKAYVLYKEGKLVPEQAGDTAGWFLLDPNKTFKFNLNKSDFPILINTIPAILDLESAQELERKKALQQLLKIIIQKMPLDKNGDLIFDVEEARDLHNTAVNMLSRAVGVDVLTTFADIDVADMQERATAAKDELAIAERTVFNSSGISQNVFNAVGNLSVNKSVLNDESSMRDLVYQFQVLLNRVASRFNEKNNYQFRVHILETTIYNYQELSKLYKEQVQIGYSKMLPQIALGHSQSSILANAHFENEILHLSDIMVPPMMSSTMSGKGNNNSSDKTDTSDKSKTQTKIEDENNQGGRPEKPDDEKSEKTIKNLESQS